MKHKTTILELCAIVCAIIALIVGYLWDDNGWLMKIGSCLCIALFAITNSSRLASESSKPSRYAVAGMIMSLVMFLYGFMMALIRGSSWPQSGQLINIFVFVVLSLLGIFGLFVYAKMFHNKNITTIQPNKFATTESFIASKYAGKNNITNLLTTPRNGLLIMVAGDVIIKIGVIIVKGLMMPGSFFGGFPMLWIIFIGLWVWVKGCAQYLWHKDEATKVDRMVFFVMLTIQLCFSILIFLT